MASNNYGIDQNVLPAEQRLKNLQNVAYKFNVDKNQPIRRYYRSGAEMVKMADTYMEEEYYEKAYILYLKYLTLFIEKVREHPEFKSVTSAEKSKVMKTLKAVMPRSEELKKLLKAQYEAEYEDYQQMVEIEMQRQAQVAEEQRKWKLQQEGENLRKEISKYHDEKAKTVQEQRDLEVAMWHQLKINNQEDQERKKVQNYDGSGVNYNQDQSLPSYAPPDRSTKPKSTASAPVIPDRSSKPSSMSLYSGSGGLRQVTVPNMLMAKFLSIAQSNTSSNIETCGFLTGRLSQNQFKITHLLIPKQSGTSDSCVTSGEETMFDYQEKHDLITLGWIHTHPTQTAFLSSVDLHTQLSYQLMLPEAIAIVISPKYNETGFFSLTPDHGLDFIANCRESGFHPHPKEPPLFAELGHVQLDHQSDVTIVDLRKM